MTVGTVVKRSPNSSIAKSALNDLGQALNLFEKCASSSHRNRIAYVIMCFHIQNKILGILKFHFLDTSS